MSLIFGDVCPAKRGKASTATSEAQFHWSCS
jgi:hypothetical protein